MNDGKHSEQMLDAAKIDGLRPELLAFAKWLLGDERTLEVWGLAGAKTARVECVAEGLQSLELDSGDWFLVRVSTPSVPTILSTPSTPGRSGIIRFRRQVDSGHRKDV